MKLNKTNIRKALKGWGASGPEMPQKDAITVCMEILTGLRPESTKRFNPLGDIFTVDRVTQTIARQNRYTGKTVEVFDFSEG